MNASEPKRFSFSGHDSFQCRSLWLKKGYDFVNNNNSFNDEDAVVKLGVGKNMVGSIKYWMKAFDILNEKDQLTPIAHKLLSDDGWDPFLEDLTSLWLLHFNLVYKGYATTYSLLFNELRKEKIEFSKTNFIAFIKNKAQQRSIKINENTISSDYDVMVKMYNRTNQQSNDKEDGLSGILVELGIMNNFFREKKEIFTIDNNERKEIPIFLILYSILVNSEEDNISISFAELEQGYNSIGNIYAIGRNELIEKLEEITQHPIYKGNIIFSDHAGIKELQFKKRPEPISVLEKYYEKNNAE